MTRADGCLAISPRLEAFVDDELGGRERLEVAEHLRACATCSAYVESVRRVGETLRADRPSDVWMDDQLNGLGPRVVARFDAEERLTFPRIWERVFDGWRWSIVAAGSVCGTLLSTSIVTMVLAFGPAPVHEESLSSLMGNLASPPGYLFVIASTVDDEALGVWQVENGQPVAPRVVAALARNGAGVEDRPTEAQLVDELASTVTRNGRVFALASMDRATRARAEALFDEITSLRRGPNHLAGPADRTISVKQLRLVTTVTAKS